MSKRDDANTPDASTSWKDRDGDTVIKFLVAIALIGLMLSLVLPEPKRGHTPASREKCAGNLRQIAVALHNYHEDYGSFPPAYVVDETGTPLYSWRVLVLPYLEQDFLYEQFHLDESWGSPHNAALLTPAPAIFRCPAHKKESSRDSLICTHYSGIFGPRCVFQGAEPVSLDDITDERAETLLLAEVTDAGIPWSAPRDIDMTLHPKLGDRQGFSSKHPGGLHAVRANGAVRFLLEKTDGTTVRRLMICDDGQKVGEF